MGKPYITTRYHDLSQYEGHELVIVRGWREFAQFPDKVVFLKDYGNTILVELTFSGSEFFVNLPPRKYKKALQKSSLAVSEYLVRDAETGEYLVGEVVTDIDFNALPSKLEGVKIWE